MSKNINILYLCQNYNSFIKDQIEVLSKNFNEVNVLVRHNYFSELGPVFKINYLLQFTERRLLDLENKPNNVNVYLNSLFYAPTNRQYKNLGEKHFYTVDKTIRNKGIKFDLTHSHFIWSSGYVGMKLKNKYNIPFIVTAHGFDVYDLPFRDDYWSNTIRNILNSSDYIITVSKKNLEYINKLGINNNVEIIPNGYKKELFYKMDKIKCRNLLSIPKDKIILLNIGHIIKVKGHIFLIEALEKLVQIRNDFICYVIGEGNLKNMLIKIIEKKKLSKYIIFIDYVDHKNIPIWMNSADLFILPSLNEGNPTVLVESLAVGLPFIGSNVGGIPEIVISDKYGFLCKPGDSNELFSAINKGIDNNWDHEGIIKHAEKYSWDILCNKISEIYSKVIDHYD